MEHALIISFSDAQQTVYSHVHHSLRGFVPYVEDDFKSRGGTTGCGGGKSSNNTKINSMQMRTLKTLMV